MLKDSVILLFAFAYLAVLFGIAKTQRITSIADFIASRYGKSTVLAGLVTIIAVVGIMPYISLQLKAVSKDSAFSFVLPKLKAQRLSAVAG